jgi:hypothetical protein
MSRKEIPPVEQQEICAGFEVASDQVIQLLHYGASLSESQQLQIKHTIEVLRLTFDDWAKAIRVEQGSETLQKSEPISAPPLATQ